MTLFTRYPRAELEGVVAMARLLADDLTQARPAAQRLAQFAANAASIDDEFASIAAKLRAFTAESVENVIDTEAYFAARAAAANLLRLLPAACNAADDETRAAAIASIASMIETMTSVAHLDEPDTWSGAYEEDEEEGE